jgi:bis(5'-nucleosyl)-tetraphosphatase (symmetrical)
MIYAIGDVQGCFYTFLKLVASLPSDDEIWLCGDIINRGPESLKMLRWVYRNQDRCKLVLGNHDIHVIAVLAGIRTIGKLDTLYDLQNAPDRYKLVDFLRKQPFIQTKNKVSMVHAGFLNVWNLEIAHEMSNKLQEKLQSNNWQIFLRDLFGNQPNTWHNELLEMDKLRLAMNVFTRMRYATKKGEIEFQQKKYPPNEELTIEYRPWFEWYNQKGLQNLKMQRQEIQTIIFGHWSDIGLVNSPYAIGIDTGCAWKRKLTAIEINSNNPEDREFFQQTYID